MATEIYYLSGMAKWCHLAKPSEKFNRYTLSLFPDDKSWGLYEDSGLDLKMREDEDGKFILLSAKVKEGDEPEKYQPKILDTEGNPWPSEGKHIGNGSLITCKVEVYDTTAGKGHRLKAVRVENLVEYEGPKVYGMDGEESPF